MSEAGVNLPEIEIDLRDESITAFGGGGGPILPVGAYTMDVVSAEQGTSKKGGPTCKVTFKVADEGEFFGTELMKTYSLQTKPSKEGGTPAIGRFKNLMMAAGCQLDKIRLAELVGARVIVEITHEQGEGVLDAQGNMQPGKTYCNICNEKAVAVEEPAAAATPPPVAKGGKAQPQPAAPAAPTATRNGAPAARRA
jgi:hypothetical protein